MPFIRSYCARHGYELFTFTTSDDPTMFASWNKLLVTRRIIDREFVLVIDADCCPMPEAGPIHEVLDPDRLNMVRLKYTAWRLKRMRAEGFDVRDGTRLSTGMMGVPRTAEEMLGDVWGRRKELAVRTSCGHEQEHVNDAILATGFPVNELNAKWNFVVRKGRVKPCAYTDQFIHCVGTPKQKLSAIQALHRYFKP